MNAIVSAVCRNEIEDLEFECIHFVKLSQNKTAGKQDFRDEFQKLKDAVHKAEVALMNVRD